MIKGAASSIPAKTRLPGLILAALLIAAFLPLFAGYHFLPIGRHGIYTRGLAESMGSAPAFDDRYLERYGEHPWLIEPEPAWFTLYIPQGLYTAGQVREGLLPLWDPYSGCGTPTLDSGYFRPFDPFKLPFYALPNLWTYALGFALLLGFGAWGAWAWLREEGCPAAAGAFGAAVFALNPWVLERLALPDAAAYLVFPWCILGLRGMRPGDWRSVARGALPLVLMGHLGHAEVCLILACVAGMAVLFRRSAGSSPTGRILSLCAAAVAVLLALSVLWVPLLTLALNSVSYKEAGARLVFPYAWKALLTPGSDLFLLPVLAGMTLCGLLWGRGRAFWGVLAVGALVTLMPLPILDRAIAESLFRVTGIAAFYLKPVLWLSLSYLGAQGWEALESRAKPRAWAALGATAPLVAGMGLFLFAWGPLPASELAVRPGVTVLLCGVGLFVPLLLMVRKTTWQSAATLLLALVPLAFPLPLNQLTWNRFRLSEHDLAKWMRVERPHERAVSIGFRPSFAIPPNWGQALGVRTGEHNSVFFPEAYIGLYGSKSLPRTLVAFDSPQMEAFRQLGASVVLVPNPHALEGATLLRSGRWASAFDVPGTSGRAYLAERVAPREPAEDLSRQIIRLGEGSASVAVVDAPGDSGARILAPCAPGSWTLRFEEDGPHRVSLFTGTASPGLLVLKDTWYPGWKAEIDGNPAPIYRVNGCFRGVPMPAGEHRVEFFYRPWHVYIPMGVSSVATLILILLAIRRRRS